MARGDWKFWSAMRRRRLERRAVRAGAAIIEADDPKTGAVAAIQFAVKIEDHFNRLEFLNGWLHGDLHEWPEFLAGRDPDDAAVAMIEIAPGQYVNERTFRKLEGQ